jgi:L-threonylcarbamoyladenylate synthase
VPLAAPSANASTKPSPTTAQHVRHDLDGRIELILDGGACDVGVESTVVDGLCEPPAVLRPGGVSMDEIRSCPGWENVVKAYKDRSEEGKAAPRAPGMKYKHYSPRATVVLYEATCDQARDGIVAADMNGAAYAMANGNANGVNGSARRKIGVVRTRRWKQGAGLKAGQLQPVPQDGQESTAACDIREGCLLDADGQTVGTILDIDLGTEIRGIAQGLFSALRELDLRGADTIFVDGVGDDIDIAAAVMNRLRKAASEIRV